MPLQPGVTLCWVWEGFDESLNYFDQALAKDPNITEAQVYKGMALYFSGKVDEAMEIEPFKAEFLARFKNEMVQRASESPGHGA